MDNSSLLPPSTVNALGCLQGLPPRQSFDELVTFVGQTLPSVAQNIKDNSPDVANEKGITEVVITTLEEICHRQALPFHFHKEPPEDLSSGNSPSADIGVSLRGQDGIPPSRRRPFFMFEAKCLTSRLAKHREREYVVGGEKAGKRLLSGGLERFKLGLHGRRLKAVGMLGYMQTDCFDVWRAKINHWIEAQGWREGEQLKAISQSKVVAQHESTLSRDDGQNVLVHHLWVDLVLERPNP